MEAIDGTRGLPADDGVDAILPAPARGHRRPDRSLRPAVPGDTLSFVDFIVALLGAVVVIGAAAVAMRRSDVAELGTPTLAAAGGAAVGAAAAVVFLVPQMDLVPDNVEGGVELVILVASGAAIAGLGWRRRRAG